LALEVSKRPSHVDTVVLIDGLEQARVRFASSTPGTAESFQAAFEVLAWAGVLRDRFRHEARAIPPVLNGLWYVRNVALHQGADVLAWVMVPPALFDAVQFNSSLFDDPGHKEWTWPQRSELPEPESKRGASDYDTRLAGRSVVEVLDELADSIAR
jgi:hypothetical protein